MLLFQPETTPKTRQHTQLPSSLKNAVFVTATAIHSHTILFPCLVFRLIHFFSPLKKNDGNLPALSLSCSRLMAALQTSKISGLPMFAGPAHRTTVSAFAILSMEEMLSILLLGGGGRLVSQARRI